MDIAGRKNAPKWHISLLIKGNEVEEKGFRSVKLKFMVYLRRRTHYVDGYYLVNTTGGWGMI